MLYDACLDQRYATPLEKESRRMLASHNLKTFGVTCWITRKGTRRCGICLPFPENRLRELAQLCPDNDCQYGITINGLPFYIKKADTTNRELVFRGYIKETKILVSIEPTMTVVIG